jgi:hypothetical protein
MLGQKWAVVNGRLSIAMTQAAGDEAILSTWAGGLPSQPITGGFAINTIFYAAILWLLFFAPASVRRMIRRRRGLCPACAYPVGTSPVCTECGAAVVTNS